MSTAWKLGTFGISAAYAAYLLGLRIAGGDSWGQISISAGTLAFSLGFFLREVFLLKAILDSAPVIKDQNGRTLIP